MEDQSWKKSNKQNNVWANSSKTLLVAINFQEYHYHVLEEHSKDTVTNTNTTRFLRQMEGLFQNPKGKILILDNCWIHKTLDVAMYFNSVKEYYNIEVKIFHHTVLIIIQLIYYSMINI